MKAEYLASVLKEEARECRESSSNPANGNETQSSFFIIAIVLESIVAKLEKLKDPAK